jgi:hypothetical protein
LQRRREIALEELQALLIKSGYDGRSAETNKKRVELLEKHFGTSSKTAIENLPIRALETTIGQVKLELFPVSTIPGIDDDVKSSTTAAH